MAESHFISALRQRRADRIGELEQVRASIAELEAEEAAILQKLANVEALVRDEAPELLLENINPRKPRLSKPDDGKSASRLPLSKAILRMLRVGKKQMTARDLRHAIPEEYAEKDDKKLLRNISTFLSVKKSEGILGAVANDDGTLRYRKAA